MNDAPKPGPQRDTLLNLKAMLPSLFRGLKDGSIGKRVQQAKLIRQPRKFCTVCGKAWDHTFVKLGEETTTKPENCSKCDARLKDGETALVCVGHDVYFSRMPERFSDMWGEVITVAPHVMEMIKREYKTQMEKKSK